MKIKIETEKCEEILILKKLIEILPNGFHIIIFDAFEIYIEKDNDKVIETVWYKDLR